MVNNPKVGDSVIRDNDQLKGTDFIKGYVYKIVRVKEVAPNMYRISLDETSPYWNPAYFTLIKSANPRSIPWL